MYYQGQVDAAVQALKPIADNAVASGSSIQGKIALEYLLDTCVAAWDYRCLNEYLAKYSQLVASLTDVPGFPEVSPLRVQPLPTILGVAVWLSGNRSWAEARLKAWPGNCARGSMGSEGLHPTPISEGETLFNT